MVLESPFAAALNRLLAAEGWARERLAPFAGEVVELRAPPLPALRLRIEPGGTTAPAPSAAAPSLTLRLGPATLAALARGEDHLQRAVDVSGNARLATEVLFLLHHLRWDAEEELSRLVGDVAAHRVAGAARGLAAWQADAARRLAESAADWLIDEKRLLVRRGELEGIREALAALRDGIERLEKRIARLG